MIRTTLLAILLLTTPARAGIEDAVIRIPSHGCSGTVIQTEPGRSLILSCAHAFEGRDRLRPIRLDGPTQTRAVRRRASRVRLLTVDYQLDLSLIEIDNGPFFCCPVAPAGHRPGSRLLSCGYDEMRWPITVRPCTYLGSTSTLTFTRERPWHGRSGGGLLDAGAGVLIGVVMGYETSGSRRGLYVSHEAILTFLRSAGHSGRGPPSLPVAPLPARPSRQPCPT
jgi:Trypsin-like peptidase domain